MTTSRRALRILELNLRKSILPKLKKEVITTAGAPSNTKKSTLDTHRGETYQFCYFFRKTEPHSVVVKSRTFVAIPPQKQVPMHPPPASQRGKRKSKSDVERGSNEGTRKKRKTKGKGRARDEDNELLTLGSDISDEDYDPAEPQRSKRAPNSNQTEDINIIGQTFRSTPTGSAIDIEMDQEEEKPKPVLQLRYQGFDIFGHCLCVVVEPWPPIRSMSRAPSVTTVLNREPHLARPQSVLAQDPDVRTRTPLFLPDDYGERSEISRDHSMPPPSLGSILDPRFLEDSDDSDEDEGMVLFSQVLNNVGDVRAGAADDDEDMDTDMFFGDADERREL
ncbi:hypothetical protein C0993_000044 [Termitomyces sp. T159_Od127]|nr:hypothetical protein C0993_000044 [Termitomyces sp. T159_Od127]